MSYSPHIRLSKLYWKEHLQPGDVAVDATCGNGHDTVFLATFPLSALFAIDIQKEAIESTKARMREQCEGRGEYQKYQGCSVTFHHMSHEQIDQLHFSIAPKLIVYNLGYLPGSDKTVMTRKESTLASLQKGIELLAAGGALSITCYPHHQGGEEEQRMILDWAKTLPATVWEACHHQWINRHAFAPSLLWITRIPR